MNVFKIEVKLKMFQVKSQQSTFYDSRKIHYMKYSAKQKFE